MYNEWCNLEGDVLGFRNQISVLNRFPPDVSRIVSNQIIGSISANRAKLELEKDVKWSEEVICYGLSLSFTDDANVQTVKDGVSIYCSWLRVLCEPNDKIPLPIRKSPEPHIRRIVEHLKNLFNARSSRYQKTQEELCRKVLFTIVLITKESSLEPKTWEAILIFLLHVTDKLLSPPLVMEHLAHNLCSDLVKALFETWIVACSKCFPTPTFWKTLSQFVQGWLHHMPVLDWWARFTLVLGDRVIQTTQGSGYPRSKFPDDDESLVVPLDKQVCTQTWFRFLQLIENPVQLTDAAAIARRPKFIQMAKLNPNKDDLPTNNHPCLANLPLIFLRTMQGVSKMVDGFLGIESAPDFRMPRRRSEYSTSASSTGISASSSPPTRPKRVREVSRRPSQLNLPDVPKSDVSSSGNSSFDKKKNDRNSSSQILPDHPVLEESIKKRYSLDHIPRERPYVNSVLHLFGKWLFEASLVADGSAESDNLSQTRSVTGNIWSSDAVDLTEGNEAGRAEALGCLSRILSTIRTNEKVLPAYLARSYLALSHGLLEECNQYHLLRASIILNSVDFFRIDLPGVTALLPCYFIVLQDIISSQNLASYKTNINIHDLRFASISILLSVLPYPIHYASSEINLLPSVEINKHSVFKFAEFSSKQSELLLTCITIECESINLQYALAGLNQLLIDKMEASKETRDSCVENDAHSTDSESTLQSEYFPNYSLSNASGLLLKTVEAVNNKLKIWGKSSNRNLSTILSAFELLSAMSEYVCETMSRTRMLETCREVVLHLCAYIQNSIERPKVEHKRELHSGIVAAFRCLSKWLAIHCQLLQDSSFLYYLMEILELGISGSKSRQPSGININKNNKVNEPVSGRVRHAAEEVLNLLFQNQTKDSLIDESSLGDELDFYVLYGNSIATIHEIKESSIPTMIMLLRHPGGRTAWKFENKINTDGTPVNEYKVANAVDKTEYTSFKRAERPPIEIVPPGVEKIPTTRADYSIPDSFTVAESADVHTLKQINQIRALLDGQIQREKEVLKAHEDYFVRTLPPLPVTSFQSSRLLFSHFGLLGIDSVSRQSNPSDNSDLIRLRVSPDLLDELKTLDQMPQTHHDTGFIFYVRTGLTAKEEIYASAMRQHKESLDSNFIDFLFSLGDPVDIENHSYWSGNVRTSYKIGQKKTKPSTDLNLNDRGISCFNGDTHLLYWSDHHNEISFVIPSLAEPTQPSFNLGQDESTESQSISSSNRRSGGLINCDSRTLVIWLEDYDDINYIPTEVLSVESTTGEEPLQDPTILFIHPLRNALYRITVRTSHNVKGHPAPLVSGCVISKRVLGALLRETIVNHGNRRRLDSDTHTHPNHRRSRKIQDIKERFQDIQSDHRFYSQIIQDIHKQDRRGSTMSQASHAQSIDLHL